MLGLQIAVVLVHLIYDRSLQIVFTNIQFVFPSISSTKYEFLTVPRVYTFIIQILDME